MDGITKGGGVGISQPARYLIATERTVYAMPETGIGLFPDVGGGRYLSRLHGRSGRYLAVTGARIDGADAVALGLATHFIPSDRIDKAKAALIADAGRLFSFADNMALEFGLACRIIAGPISWRAFARSSSTRTILPNGIWLRPKP